MMLLASLTKLVFVGHRHLGQQPAGGLGLRHHQLRLVDRHRPRRHADLGDPAVAQAGVADLDQPLRRGDDAVRRRLRGASIPLFHTGRPWLAIYWLLPYPNTMGMWPNFRSPADLGRLRGLDLRRGLAAVLVHRPDSRPRDAARPGGEGVAAEGLRHVLAGLAQLGAALAQLRVGVPAARRTVDAAGALGPLGGVLRLRLGPDPRLARHDLPALLRRGRGLRRLRDGADAGDPAAPVLRARGLHHHAPPRQHGPR